MRLLAEAKWPDAVDTDVVLVPVGSIEQHGPHLPLDTDTVIAEEVTRRLAERIPGSWVAPALTYGSSGEHQSFPGTSSIGTDVLHLTVVELVRSLRSWAKRVVLVNAHGGNLSALTSAVAQLRHEGHDVVWIPCVTELNDLHAGLTETSLMLHLRPWAVRMERAEPGNTSPLAEVLATMIARGVSAVSANGVLGDPTSATAQLGGQLLEEIVEAASARLLAVSA